MSSLPLTESAFQGYVLGTGSGIAGDITGEVTGDVTGDVTADIAREIVGESDEFRRTRLDIYRDAYRLRLIEVLGNDYPVLKSRAGDEWFEAIATDYIAAHPSVFRNVRWFGAAMPDFLRERPNPAQQPVFADLALFEWTLGLAFDSLDQHAVDFAAVAAVAPEAWSDLRFQPHASLHVLELGTNAVAIWKAIEGDEPATMPEAVSEPVTWAIWRKELSPYFRSLAADEAWALSAMRDGASFGEICAGLCDWVTEEQAAARAAQLLRGWVDEGWISGLITS